MTLYYQGHPLSRFWEGDCPIFAIALNQLSRWPLFALVEHDANLGKLVLVHAYVKSPEGRMLDAAGLEDSSEHLLEEFPHEGGAYEMAIEKAELLAIGYGTTPVPDLASVLVIAQVVLDSVGEDYSACVPGQAPLPGP